jgi:protein CpxP
MTSIKNTLLTGAAALVLSITSSAFAQQAPAQGGERMDRAKMAEKMKERAKEGMEKRHEHFHDQLKLTPAQEPAWKVFTEATKPQEKAMQHDRKAMAEMPAPARMEMMLTHDQDRLATMQKHLGALKTFYAVLSPEQQKNFDKMSMRMHQQRKHMRGERQEKMQKMHKMEKMHEMMHDKETMKTTK